MAKSKNKRVVLTPEEKLYKAIQALFILQARKIDMPNKEMREILGVERADIDAVAKVINKALSKQKKDK